MSKWNYTCIHDTCIHDACPPAAAAPPIESMVKFRDILSMGGAAAAGPYKGTNWLDVFCLGT